MGAGRFRRLNWFSFKMRRKSPTFSTQSSWRVCFDESNSVGCFFKLEKPRISQDEQKQKKRNVADFVAISAMNSSSVISSEYLRVGLLPTAAPALGPDPAAAICSRRKNWRKPKKKKEKTGETRRNQTRTGWSERYCSVYAKIEVCTDLLGFGDRVRMAFTSLPPFCPGISEEDWGSGNSLRFFSSTAAPRFNSVSCSSPRFVFQNSALDTSEESSLHHLLEAARNEDISSTVGWQSGIARKRESLLTKQVDALHRALPNEFLPDNLLFDVIREDQLLYEKIREFEFEGNALQSLSSWSDNSALRYLIFPSGPYLDRLSLGQMSSLFGEMNILSTWPAFSQQGDPGAFSCFRSHVFFVVACLLCFGLHLLPGSTILQLTTSCCFSSSLLIAARSENEIAIHRSPLSSIISTDDHPPSSDSSNLQSSLIDSMHACKLSAYCGVSPLSLSHLSPLPPFSLFSLFHFF